jgi:DNA-binding NarL/FixJ family response regulator
MPSIRILIADDRPDLRQGLRRICELERDFEVVGEAENGAKAVTLAHQLQPDVILIGIETSVLDDVQAIRSITAYDSSARVIALTTCSSDGDVLRAIKAGAHGCLPEDVAGNVLVGAIWAVYRGEALIDSHVTAVLLDEIRRADESMRKWGRGENVSSQRVGEDGVQSWTLEQGRKSEYETA